MSKRKTNSKKPKGGGGDHINTTTDTVSTGVSSVGGTRPTTVAASTSATAHRAPPQLLALEPVVLDRADATVGVEVIIHSCLATTEKNNGLPGTITKSYDEASGLVGVEVGARSVGARTRPTMSFKLHNLVKHPPHPASWEEFDALTPPPFYGDKTTLAPEYHNSCALTTYKPMLELMYGDDNMDADDVWVEHEHESLKVGPDGCRMLPGAVLVCDLPLIKALGRRNTDFNQNIVIKKADVLTEMPNTAPLLAMLQCWAGYRALPDDLDASTPFCVGRRRIETLDFMLSAGADPNVCDPQGQSLLHFAVAIENLDPNDVDNRAVLPLLLRHKADHTKKDGQGARPVDGYLHTVSALCV
jgi:hypothetical protein